MKIVAAVLCLALAPSWERSARAEEVQPDFNGLERADDAAETYRLNALEIVHHRISGSFGTIFLGRSNLWRPVRGKFRYSTTYDAFFLKLGRDDLGERDRHRRLIAETFFWGGVIASVGGLAVILSGVVANRDTRAEVGLGMVGGGLVLTTVGSRIQPPLVSEEDALEMASEYNRRLRVYLGLAPLAMDTARDWRPFGLSLSRRW